MTPVYGALIEVFFDGGRVELAFLSIDDAWGGTRLGEVISVILRPRFGEGTLSADVYLSGTVDEFRFYERFVG